MSVLVTSILLFAVAIACSWAIIRAPVESKSLFEAFWSDLKTLISKNRK